MDNSPHQKNVEEKMKNLQKTRDDTWWRLDEKMQEEIRASREDFINQTLEDGNAGKSFYAAAKKLSAPGDKSQWSVSDLFVGSSPSQICDNVLDYFGNIAASADDAEPPQLVHRCEAGLPEFTPADMVKLLKASKKTNSRVLGDPLPHLVRLYPDAFAVAVADIFNKVNRSSEWPTTWKREHLTVIPKFANPGSLGECRNISCTSVFSKVLENQLLAKLRAELDPDNEQYGGIKGCGAEHLLIDLWEEVLSSMEGGKCAGVLLGVDFEKAFNQMDHVCLRQLKRLGCLLYCVTTQHLTHNIDPVPPRDGMVGVQVRGEANDPETGMALPRIGAGVKVSYFPQDDEDDDEIEFWVDDNWEEESPAGCVLDGVPQLVSFKYIDDTTNFLPAKLDEASLHLSRGKTVQRFENLCLGPVMEGLSGRSDEIGMKINTSKTQLMVISPPNGCNSSAIIKVRGAVVESATAMKLIGFHFGESPGAEAHAVQLRNKFRRKIWIIYHLREAGLKGHLYPESLC